jgi:hypothetical protein
MGDNDEIGGVNFSHPIDTQLGAVQRAYDLFREIKRLHGEATARDIFKDVVRPMIAVSPRRAKQLRTWMILDRYDRMPRPSVRALASEIAREQWKKPTPENVETVRTHIRNLIKMRNEGLKAGTWRGPVKGDPGRLGPGAMVRIRTL